MELHPILLGDEIISTKRRELSISTWNVWFDRFHREQRNRALLEELGRHRPDVMVFQEVTLPFVRAIQACEWMKSGYWLSAADHSQIGVVMVSNLPCRRLSFRPLTSDMGRRLLVAEFPGVTVASAHFESNRNSQETREKQFEETFRLLENESSAVLLGDFNSTPEQREAQTLNARFRDAWESSGDGSPGHTIDTTTNKMAWRDIREEKKLRIDRILVRGGVEVEGACLLGTAAFEGELHASDHYGVLARLNLRRS